MKHITSRLFGNRFVIGGIILIVIIVLFFLGRGDDTPKELITVERGSIMQEVVVTGITKPTQSVELAFERSGKVSRVNADVGTKIKIGQTLVVLDQSELVADLREAEANVAVQKAKLVEVQRGTRPEELQVSVRKVDNAKIALGNAQNNLFDVLVDAYTKADDAVRNKLDQMILNPRTNPRLNFSVSNTQIKFDVELGRKTMEDTLTKWKILFGSTLTSAQGISYVGVVKKNLDETKFLLDNAAIALNDVTPNESLTQTTIDGWKTSISTARTNVGTAISNLTTAEEKYNSAKSDLALNEDNLLLAQAGSLPEQIAAMEAQVAQAEAKADKIRVELSKTVLRAPIDGVITKRDVEPGEIVSLNTIVMSAISEGKLEIEANIPEVDVVKVKRENPVRITFDAIPGENFAGSIVSIYPAETVIDGVSYFKVKIILTASEDRLKSGLTANLRIETLKKDNVLFLPQFAVLERDDGTFVKQVESESEESREVKVKLGVRGQDGSVEVLEGLQERDEVLNVGLK